VDSIKTEGAKNLEIYLNPDYIKLIKTPNIDLELLKTNLNDCYKLQLINIDVAQDQIINIKLNELRNL
jgi:hypothetical protein